MYARGDFVCQSVSTVVEVQLDRHALKALMGNVW